MLQRPCFRSHCTSLRQSNSLSMAWSAAHCQHNLFQWQHLQSLPAGRGCSRQAVCRRFSTAQLKANTTCRVQRPGGDALCAATVYLIVTKYFV